eukprot:38681-Alexandrium_andersonii.AAC.1
MSCSTGSMAIFGLSGVIETVGWFSWVVHQGVFWYKPNLDIIHQNRIQRVPQTFVLLPPPPGAGVQVTTCQPKRPVKKYKPRSR